ncbi:hypothetical protein [Ligilactobacillus saerimneri]|uniref:hypothetical protein n=1 Tax=Ligilactobacillus saerimneri TaxID=228229 RepID=UPI001C116B68|nr:hypothetical protein [Ligilactobacillus saerimneri]MBU5309265.1 hypothetical protein [Ligilactobacillus saerimneri]
MTKAGDEGTKKEPTAIGSNIKLLQEEYSTKIEIWERVAMGGKLILEKFDEERDEFEINNRAAIADRYKLALDKIAYYKRLLAEVTDE